MEAGREHAGFPARHGRTGAGLVDGRGSAAPAVSVARFRRMCRQAFRRRQLDLASAVGLPYSVRTTKGTP